jgi:hypothetical protein
MQTATTNAPLGEVLLIAAVIQGVPGGARNRVARTALAVTDL